MKKSIKVKPNAKKEAIVEESDGTLTVFLTAPPIEGKANSALIALLAKKYGIKKQEVVIRSGLNSRQKIVEIILDS